MGLLLLLLLPACGGGEQAPPADSDIADVSIEDVAEEHLTSPVAVVNGTEIYRANYEQVLVFLRGQIDAEGAENVERYLKARDDALERAIDMELLFQEAERRGHGLKPGDLHAEYARRVARADSEEAYLASARGQMFSKSEVLDGIRREQTVNRYIEEEIISRVSLSEEDLRAYYDLHPLPFTTEKKVRLGSIFMAAPQGGTASERASALTRISQALERLKKGEAFAQVAREVSEDEVASIGGRLGAVRRGFLPRELEQVAFSLKTGEVSTIIETEAGFHLLKVHKVEGGELKPFEEVKDEVSRRLLELRKNEQLRGIVKGLRAQAEITRQLS